MRSKDIIVTCCQIMMMEKTDDEKKVIFNSLAALDNGFSIKREVHYMFVRIKDKEKKNYVILYQHDEHVYKVQTILTSLMYKNVPVDSISTPIKEVTK